MSSWGITVDVDEFELHSQGWHHESECDVDVPQSNGFDLTTVERFHNDEHDGAARWCNHSICSMMFRMVDS